ncbi:similar to Saccharomyces cerevisiae YDL161W ENT1 Epsin-like protein involved in endocytosis and actin patch assembly and functionally redundant with Ent2p [Maudiozyma saulgeensis]|uniref:Similar to Saccharomyces cerevisiae YDL161W ENT1 Epsin-like protein involved in endocytosis and actin patch assembly and functionally redundant with Ent2p n=1 Tax=Maudiozyma saulgeensis TaxID=1789683 RepID=A0A1X7R2S1_9SACH|nr:similar to Saccharomyces cerevisiae YDL161W ENT1 Epsin-like protein involved in endocytosis and actin patch assembly and functionally redundant with Ent2p [Kazachstania saulgeensis]
MSKQFVRSAKNAFKGYSSAQVLVRDATSNDMRSTNIGLMQEIAARTYDSVEFFEIMEMLDKRLNDKGKYWKHVVKSLTVLDYLVRFGSENCVLWCKENLYIIKTLKEFRYDDENNIDQGQIIRVKAKDLADLLADDERLRDERRLNQSRNYNNPNRNNERRNRSRGNSRSRRSNNNDNNNNNNNNMDDDLRKAIEESKLTVQEDEERRRQLASYDDEDPEFQAALQLSKEEEELKNLQDMQKLHQQQYQLQQQQTTNNNNTIMANGYFDIFGNPISADEYNQYQQQQNLWEQQQQEQQRIAHEQYMAQQQEQEQQKIAQEQYMAHQQQLQFQQQQQMQQMQQMQQQQANAAYQQPLVTGSNNPFALDNLNTPVLANNNNISNQQQNIVQPSFNDRPDLTLNQQNMQQTQIPPPQSMQNQVSPPPQQQQPLKQTRTGNEEITQKYSQLNTMLANGTGIDTFGNTGEQRIPAQHTATGTFINSQGTGYRQETNEPKNNPFLNSQYTGLPSSGIVPLHTGYGFGNQGPQDNQPTQQQQQQQQNQTNQYNQQQNNFPQPPQFQTQNQYQQQNNNGSAPDQGISLIDL